MKQCSCANSCRGASAVVRRAAALVVRDLRNQIEATASNVRKKCYVVERFPSPRADPGVRPMSKCNRIPAP